MQAPRGTSSQACSLDTSHTKNIKLGLIRTNVDVADLEAALVS